jgi:hypothetical protein
VHKKVALFTGDGPSFFQKAAFETFGCIFGFLKGTHNRVQKAK